MAPSAWANLVLVMREDQVHAAGVDVDRRAAQQAQRHGRTLDVPARTSGPDSCTPTTARQAFDAFPQHEVAGIVFRVFVDVHARPGIQAIVIEPGQTSIGWQRRDLEVHRAVAVVGVPVPLERANHLAHRVDIGLIGRPWRFLGRFDPEQIQVVLERLNPLLGVFTKRYAGLSRAGNRLVVDVGVVDDVRDAKAAQVLQRTPEHVEADERPEVSDVAAVVHREAAGIHADRVVAKWRERLFLSRQRVEQTEHAA